MTGKDGRDAERPYRVRVGGTWYWVDPTLSQAAIEPGDTVIVYPVSGDAALAILQGRPPAGEASPSFDFVSLEGERFTVPARDIAALHLAAVDDDQT